MSRKYFLDDGIEYLPDSGELYVDGHIENLQSLENKLLQHFVSHPNQLVSKEDLYKVGWAGRICGDNPLSKAISTLRSKLKDNPRAPRYIKTVPKKGFRFVSEVSEQPIQVTVLIPKPENNKLIKIVPLSLLIAAGILMLIWFGVSALLNEKEQAPQLEKIRQLTHTPGQERAPNLSADGQFVAFTRQLSQLEFAQIVITPTNGGTEKIVTQRNYHSLAPKWHSDGRRILYHRYGDQRCEIALMELDRQLNVTSDQVLTQCGKYNQKIGLSWGPDNSIFYTDIDIQLAAHNIYRLDINNSKRHTFMTAKDSDGRGYYQIEFDPKAQVLHALLSVDWYYTKVLTFDLEAQIINQHQVFTPLFSVGSFDGNPVFKTESNNIHFLHNGKHQRLMQSLLWPIYSPHVSNSEPKYMVFVGGVFNNAELVKVDLKAQTEEVLLSGDVSHKYPVMTQSNTLYFISNRTGLYQVWKRQHEKSQQISHFDSDMRIEDIAVSADEGFIALSIEQSIHVYQLANTPILVKQPYVTLKNSQNPHFSPDGKHLWSSKKVNDRYQMTAMDLATKSLLPVSINNAYLGIFDHADGQHFAFKYEQPGIWKIQDNQLVWYKESPFVSNVRSVAINNNILTYYDDDKAKLMQLELITNQTTALADERFRFFSILNRQNDQFVVTRKRFGNTNIYLVQY